MEFPSFDGRRKDTKKFGNFTDTFPFSACGIFEVKLFRSLLTAHCGVILPCGADAAYTIALLSLTADCVVLDGEPRYTIVGSYEID